MQTTYMKGASLAPKFQIKEAFSRLPKIAAFVSNYFKSDKKLQNTLNSSSSLTNHCNIDRQTPIYSFRQKSCQTRQMKETLNTGNLPLEDTNFINRQITLSSFVNLFLQTNVKNMTRPSWLLKPIWWSTVKTWVELGTIYHHYTVLESPIK